MEQILFISVVILILFGPDKLPTIGKAIGTIVREFQTAMRPQTTASPPSAAPATTKTKSSRPKKRRSTRKAPKKRP